MDFLQESYGYFMAALKNYAGFSGRATVREYWMFVLMYIIIYILLVVVAGIIKLPIIPALFGLALLIPSIAICVRRLHDTGKTGWLTLIGLIPIVGLVLIYFLIQPSVEDNQYGPKKIA